MAYPPPPYKDAVTGTPLTGEAITGTWWAYPPQPGLLLGGHLPAVDVVSGDIVPSAGLLLGAWVPDRIGEIDITVSAPQAALVLGAVAPSFRLSTVVLVSSSGLILGAYRPIAAGAAWLVPIPCRDLDLVTAPESTLVLVGAVESDLDLDPLECL